MTERQRPVVIAGNWKMNKTITEAVAYIKELMPKVVDVSSKIYLAVPFTAIKSAADGAKNSAIVIGAQNMNDVSEGAFTGEIAGKMLKEAGAKFVILGHSERRKVFNESNAFVNKKIKRALQDSLQVILCIGETKQEREEGHTEEVLKNELLESLEGITAEQLVNVMIAYEPIWAIGTNLSASPEIAQKAHVFCRDVISQNWGETSAEGTVLLYGGSVTPANSKEFIDQPDIDGVLVGGASLTPDVFNQIVHYNEIVR